MAVSRPSLKGGDATSAEQVHSADVGQSATCPIALADNQRDVYVDADPTKSHQEYHFSIYARSCGFFGSPTGSYLRKTGLFM